MELQALLNAVSAPDPQSEAAAWRHWDSLAKPLRSLGLLENAVVQIAALTGDVRYRIDKRAVLVLCADNGVIRHGVTQTGSEVTGIVARNLTTHDTSVCHMAQIAHCDVVPVDMGVRDMPPVKGLLNRRIANGTNDMMEGPAMTRQQTEQAILTGIALVQQQKEQGVRILATGEMGIGNTTTSSAVVSVLLGCDPADVTGRGAGLSREGLQRKIDVIHQSIRQNQPDPADPLGVLSAVGGFDIAGMTGIFLGGAYYGVPILIDGFISATAALAAVRLCPQATGAILASHVSAEPAGKMLLDALGKKPLISAGMCLGEGTGAVAALPLLDMAYAVYDGMTTFEETDIEAYQPLK